MVWKTPKNDNCPTCGTNLEALNKKNKTIGFIVMEILFFGGLGLFVFGEGLKSIIGAVIFGIWVITMLLFLFVINEKIICPNCSKSSNSEAQNNA